MRGILMDPDVTLGYYPMLHADDVIVNQSSAPKITSVINYYFNYNYSE